MKLLNNTQVAISKEKLLTLVIFSFAIVRCNNKAAADPKSQPDTSAISKTTADNVMCDTMTRTEFFALMQEYNELLPRYSQVPTQKLIKLVKVYNTTQMAGVAQVAEEQAQLNKYRIGCKRHLEGIAGRLEATFGKGMTIYSEKYDLYIGIGSTFRCVDIFTIVDK